MEYITLNNQIKMPLVGFGTARLIDEECEKAVLNALSVGYRLIDTAQMYKNEINVGNAIKKSGVPREEIFVTSKLFSPSKSYELAKEGIEKSLSDLQLDYIDLMLIHEPYKESLEMYQAFKEAYQEGKIKAIGVSNFNEEFFTEFIKECGIIPAVNQVEAHIYFQQHQLHQLLEQNGTVMQSWSTLTKGKRDIFAEPMLASLAVKYSKTVPQIVLRYFVQRHIIVIPKSSNLDRIKQNIELFDFELTQEEMAEMKAIDEDKTLFGWY